MKTYKQFVAEVVALAPLAIPVGKAIGAGLAATGLTGMIMQARRQGEGKRSQPVDYGQGGTATPGPGRSTQRTHRKDRSAQRQADQAREDRRAEARLRAKERREAEQRDVKQKIDDLIGSEADRRYAKQKRKERGIEEGVASMALKAGSNLVPKIMTGIGAVGTILQASKEDKERRRQLARDNNLDITNPRDRATLGRLLKKDTEAKKRAEKGDTRSQEQYRQEKAENRKTIDATRQQMGQSKAEPGTKKRAEIDKNLKDFRDELRDVTNDPIVPSRARVRVRVGQEVPKPDTTQPPRTGASPQRVRDRRSYEAQQRRNRKEDIPEGMLPVPSMARRLMNNPPIPQQQDKEDKFKKQYDKKFKTYDKKIRDLKKELKASNKHRDEKLNYQYKDVTNPKRPSDPVKDLKKKGTA